MSNVSIGIVIPTYQAIQHLSRCVNPLIQSSLKPKILVIDSSSTDGTVDLAQSMNIETLVIPQREFNHGATRELGRRHLKTSIVVMLTQDAYLHSASMLEILVQPLISGQASISYARQVPHCHANIFANFSRQFNYPNKSHIRSLLDKDTYGVYTYFCSNSCAAYLDSALEEIGGFSHVLFGEDTLVATQLLQRNHRIAYVAEAVVYHSHNYSLREEFNRHFDIGFSRHYLPFLESDQKRGQEYVRGLLKELWIKDAWKIPYGVMQSLVKFCGYRLGQRSHKMPLWFKRLMSSQKFYWK